MFNYRHCSKLCLQLFFTHSYNIKKVRIRISMHDEFSITKKYTCGHPCHWFPNPIGARFHGAAHVTCTQKHNQSLLAQNNDVQS